MNEYLAKKDLMYSWRCERGEEVENINHVVFFCNKYEEERKGLFRRMKIRNTQIRYCMLELLGDKEWEIIVLINNLLIKINKIG